MSDLPQLVSKAKLAYSQGDLGRAERFTAEAIKISPDHLEALVMDGLIRARQGKRKEAISSLQRAVQIDPRCYEAHVALSTLLFADGNPKEAIHHGDLAIALDPRDPGTFHHLSRDLIAHGLAGEAIPYLRRALKLAPSSAHLIQDLASALTEMGQLGEALETWKQLTVRHPKLILGWLKLGGNYLALKKFEDAIACGRKAIQIDSNSADARILLGLALVERGGAPEAQAHLELATKLKPNEMIAHSAYGLVLQEMGQFEEARPRFKRALELCPTHGQAYYSLLLAQKTSAKDHEFLERIRGYLDHPDATLMDRSYMHYALGKANEDLGDYEASMSHFDQANQFAAQYWFANKPPDQTWYREMIQATLETFTPAFMETSARKPLESEKPLLVIGMMRSGTTLVEQILSSHPEIKGGGELTYWHEEVPKIFDLKARIVHERGLRQVAEGYLELLERIGPDAKRVTDKLPHNYTMIGFVLAAFPNARIIHVRRNPLDNCLSIYTTAYQHPPSYTLSRENIVFGYREYQRIMEHWRRVLPTRQFLEVNYEDIIGNREHETRRMVNFAGLDWHDACLHPEHNPRSVSTPSVWQVRQPIYKTSVERWRRFEPWLGKFRELSPSKS